MLEVYFRWEEQNHEYMHFFLCCANTKIALRIGALVAQDNIKVASKCLPNLDVVDAQDR
jgi:hypothetical protein